MILSDKLNDFLLPAKSSRSSPLPTEFVFTINHTSDTLGIRVADEDAEGWED